MYTCQHVGTQNENIHTQMRTRPDTTVNKKAQLFYKLLAAKTITFCKLGVMNVKKEHW